MDSWKVQRQDILFKQAFNAEYQERLLYNIEAGSCDECGFDEKWLMMI